MRARMLGALVLSLSLGFTLAQAEEPPLERVDLDKRIVKTVYDTAVLGTALFNKGKPEECYGLYQGVLMALQPVLDHRPKLVLTVQEKLTKARQMKPPEGAFVLREALDAIQNEIAPQPKAEGKDTLWDRLGGEAGVKKLVNDILVIAIEDPKVNLLRNGKIKLDAKGMAHFKQMLVEMISEKTGGPLKYTGLTMKVVHAGMKITEAEFNALAEVVAGVLLKNKVTEADIKAVMEFINSTKKDIVEVPAGM